MTSQAHTDTGAAPAVSFSLFSELPPELRAVIWELCLPHRVRELNVMDGTYQWPGWSIPGHMRDPMPCSLTATTRANNCPPVIAQVCREARRVAFLAAGLRSAVQGEQPGVFRWDPQFPWTDYMRDRPHFHEAPRDTYKLATLITLPWARAQSRSVQWLHVEKDPSEGDCVQYDEYRPGEISYPPRENLPDPHHHPLVHEDCLLLQQYTDWRLVVDTRIIHATAADGIASGLFGLLGDAPIQIVDAFDTTIFDKYYEMAELGECLINIEHSLSQHLSREPPEDWQCWIRHFMWCGKYPDALLSHFIPVIGEEVATATGVASIARTLAVVSELGNAGLAIYDTVQDPSSALLNVLGMMFGVGSIAKAERNGKGLAEVAKVRRGMKPEIIAALGTLFKSHDDKLQTLMKACKRPT
ncbi:hypothetical protein AMS68_002437 [Peltaster fructicola]|uniref:2EXR domain-containing protein n=1 Tax=Peltaster fructicola TaxID=286661 RepID=A0A6H0XR27_9PEZI|nr:hypothetical protein AMS68_002437 [Peltaster fructicola]